MTLNAIPHTSRNTRCHLNIPLSHFASNTNKPKLHESCSTKSKPYSMLQIKSFPCCVVKEKFRNSFVLPKKYSVREINNFPKRYNIIHKILEQATPFFPLFHQFGTSIWKFWPPQASKQIHRTVNSSIELLLTVYPQTIRNTTWMNLCPNLESARDSPENRNLKNVFPIPQKPNLRT